MSKPIIEIENISKCYRIGAHKEPYLSLRDEITKFASRLRTRNRRQSDQDFWALKDVGFNVQEGEAVGIIGRNGAGKSTLLKILSKITPPTEGRIVLRGRVASLLEVGTGFHPELTGRENIYLNGAILGMSRREVTRKFDEIVDFAEVDKFLDTPVKRYSSGMYVRLAFGVAAHLEPEILLVDEVLAVGDVQFQKKCLGKMGEVAKGGRTVLFVSHNMEAIQNLCAKAVFLSQGKVAWDGTSMDAVSRYLSKAYTLALERVWEKLSNAPGNNLVRLRRVAVVPHNKNGSHVITVCTPLSIEFEYWNLSEEAIIHLSVHVYNERGIEVFNAIPVEEPDWHGKPFPRGLYRSTFYLPGDMLNDGRYRVDIHIIKNLCHPVLQHENAVVFEVADDVKRKGNILGKWYGVVRPRLEWRTEFLSENIPVS